MGTSLFYLTAVKYTHIVVVRRLICTAAACHIHNNTQLFGCLRLLTVAKIYETHSILVTVSPGGGAISPLTLSELLELGNTLQPRAARRRRRRRRRRRHEGCLQCCIAAAASLSSCLPPICFHSSPLCISQTPSDLNSNLGSETSVTALSVDNGKI